MESQKAAVSLVEDSGQFSRMRPCLAVWDWCVTDVEGKWGGEFRKKIPGRVGWERSSLKLFCSSCQILLNKEYLIGFSQRSGNLCPYIHPKGDDLIALRIGRP